MESELTNLTPFEGVNQSIQTTDIGIGEQEMKELLEYFEGKGEAPKWLDAFISDAPSRTQMFMYVATALQLARIPSLISMLGEVNKRLYSPESLATLDVGQLSVASKNISTEIANIQESSRRTIDSIDKAGGTPGKYKELLDTLINASPQEIENIQDYLKLKSEGKDPLKEVSDK